jgi:hypothetical protein
MNRTIKKGMKFQEYKEGRKPFVIKCVKKSCGLALTTKDTYISLNRLGSSKYYKVI